MSVYFLVIYNKNDLFIKYIVAGDRLLSIAPYIHHMYTALIRIT